MRDSGDITRMSCFFLEERIFFGAKDKETRNRRGLRQPENGNEVWLPNSANSGCPPEFSNWPMADCRPNANLRQMYALYYIC